MGHYQSIYYHFIWSTKNREPIFDIRMQEFIFAKCYEHHFSNGEYQILKINGIENHVHCLLSANASASPSKIVGQIKGKTSKLINEFLKQTQKNQCELDTFGWQNGYGVFSVGHAELKTIINYIHHQKEHHQNQTYEQEIKFLVAQHKNT